MAEVEIRPQRADDIEVVLDLFERVAAEGRWIGTEAPIDREQRGARFREMQDDPMHGAFVAVIDGAIVGNIGVHGEPFGVADIGMLVADGYRGQGIGSALLDAAVSWARANGFHKLALQLWPHNARARALYDKFGFLEEGRLRRHYRRKDGSLWDAVVMGLVLDEDTPGIPTFDDLDT
jgi:RimJ/RimL family protein N-acetyltransferase